MALRVRATQTETRKRFGYRRAAVGDAPDTFTAAPSRVVEGEPLGRSAVKLGGVRSGGEGGARSRLRVPLAVRVVGGVEGVANDQLRVEAAGLVGVAAVGVATCENSFGRISARFPPAVDHCQAALKFSYRSDRVTRD